VGEYSEKRLTFSCIECVGNLTSLEEFEWYSSCLFSFFSFSFIHFWMFKLAHVLRNLLEKLNPEQLQHFVRSAVGAYVFSHVMMLRGTEFSLL
jgi:hypothetical protein